MKVYHGVPSYSYYYQTTKDFKKLLKHDDAQTTAMIVISILSIIHIYFRPTRFLENGTLNVEYNLERRLHEGYIGLDQGDNSEIEEIMAMEEDNKNEVKDL